MENMPISEVLKEKREKEGISTEKIFNEIHIPSKFIRMMENGEWENFPSKLHMKGFLRIYADYLKIPKALVEEGLKDILNAPVSDYCSKDAIPVKEEKEKNSERKCERMLKVEKSIYFLLLLAALLVILYLLIIFLLPEL